MLPVKRKQGEKCYFSPCALISKLTTSRGALVQELCL